MSQLNKLSPKGKTLRPLDLPVFTTTATFFLAWFMTLLTYVAFNALLGSTINAGLAEGLTSTDLPQSLNVDACEERFKGRQDSPTSILACGLAAWAAPDVFEDRLEV